MKINQIKRQSLKLSAIDLFSGGGGLSVGLKKGGFRLIGAIENEEHAFSTYKTNHPDVKAFKQDILTVKGKNFIDLSPSHKIDLVAGCPPCQGFTSLTSKYKRIDSRNYLINEMLRLINEIRPKAVMMENVPGLANRGKTLLNNFKNSLQKLGYEVDYKILQVADYGVPQFRRRLVLLGGLGFSIPFPNATHSKTGDDDLPKWKTVRETIGKMPKPITLFKAKSLGILNDTDWHIVRILTKENKIRLRFAKPGKSWDEIPSHLRPRCHQGKYKGFSNVYGRMSWNEVSPTITGGCTTYSKGRFGHPKDSRTISVREAALLQTFPKDYIIDTPYMEHACNIIGNALPCLFAEVLSKQCYKSIKKHLKT